MTSFTESIIEDDAVTRFELLRITTLKGVTVDDTGERAGAAAVVFSNRAIVALRKLNPHLPDATIDAVVPSLSRPPYPTLIENNRWFHGLLTDGVPVEYKDAKTGETRGGRARLIDFDNPANDDFL